VACTVLVSVSTHCCPGYHPKGTCRSARFESAASRDFRDEMAEVVTELDFLLERLGNARAPCIAGHERIFAIAGENDSKEKK